MWVQKVHRGHASAGTDAHVNGTVAVKVKHVIDRGRRRCTVCKAVQLKTITRSEESSRDVKGKEGKSKEK